MNTFFMNDSATSSKSYLLSKIENRKKKNPRLSIRHWALASGVHPSSLVRALNGSRPITHDLALKVGRALKLSDQEVQYLLDLVTIERTKNLDHRQKAVDRIRKSEVKPSREISSEVFNAIADWEHFAILSLSKVRNFKAKPEWIARRLSISPEKAQAAIERLLFLKLLVPQGSTLVAAENANLATPHDKKAGAVRKNHRQHLEKAIEALDKFKIQHREFANLSIVASADQLPEIKERLRNFIDQFNRDFDHQIGDDVFQLNVQFYPLSFSRTEST